MQERLDRSFVDSSKIIILYVNYRILSHEPFLQTNYQMFLYILIRTRTTLYSQKQDHCSGKDWVKFSHMNPKGTYHQHMSLKLINTALQRFIKIRFL